MAVSTQIGMADSRHTTLQTNNWSSYAHINSAIFSRPRHWNLDFPNIRRTLTNSRYLTSSRGSCVRMRRNRVNWRQGCKIQASKRIWVGNCHVYKVRDCGIPWVSYWPQRHSLGRSEIQITRQSIPNCRPQFAKIRTITRLRHRTSDFPQTFSVFERSIWRPRVLSEEWGTPDTWSVFLYESRIVSSWVRSFAATQVPSTDWSLYCFRAHSSHIEEWPWEIYNVSWRGIGRAFEFSGYNELKLRIWAQRITEQLIHLVARERAKTSG